MPNLASFRATSFHVPTPAPPQQLPALHPTAMPHPPPSSRPTSSRPLPADDPVELAPGDYSGHLPVDIKTMPVVPCPLIKLGNRVIICGRYSDDHPCAKAANNLGVVMISYTYTNCKPPETMTRRDRFIADWRAFHDEMYGLVPKLPTVSGSKLDLFLFAEQVLLLGGIETVIKKRGFVVLAKQMRLCKPCTSAAVVLRRAHQSLMHLYEQRLLQVSTPTPEETYLHSDSRLQPQVTAQQPTEPALTSHLLPHPRNTLADPYHQHSTNSRNKIPRISEPDTESNDQYRHHVASPRKKMRRISEPSTFSSALRKSSTSLTLPLNSPSNFAAAPSPMSYDIRHVPLPGPAQPSSLSYPPRDGARSIPPVTVLEHPSEGSHRLNNLVETGSSVTNLTNDAAPGYAPQYANQGPTP